LKTLAHKALAGGQDPPKERACSKGSDPHSHRLPWKNRIERFPRDGSQGTEQAHDPSDDHQSPEEAAQEGDKPKKLLRCPSPPDCTQKAAKEHENHAATTAKIIAKPAENQFAI
jgi:hypothetical protein